MTRFKNKRIDALVVGAGPAGLMAAEVLAQAGCSVVITEAMPSPARKFLMAGKSGLNITKAEPDDVFKEAYAPLHASLCGALEGFGSSEVQQWVRGLGQEIFTGSSGRVFPKAMKASKLLRAWLSRLESFGVVLKTKWRLVEFGEDYTFDTPEGRQIVEPKVAILAMGGGSWARLGSDGHWVEQVQSIAQIAPFTPSNGGACCQWSDFMVPHFGKPVKGVALVSGAYKSRGEFVISHNGLEGGGIYALSRALRETGTMEIDFLPDWTHDDVQGALQKHKPKETLTRFLKRVYKLTPEKIALLMEFSRPNLASLPHVLKSLEISGLTMRALDEAISTGGGVCFESLTDQLEFKQKAGLFAAGEMLDWDAPTGGYLLTACLATGRLAAQGALSAFEQASRDE